MIILEPSRFAAEVSQTEPRVQREARTVRPEGTLSDKRSEDQWIKIIARGKTAVSILLPLPEAEKAV